MTRCPSGVCECWEFKTRELFAVCVLDDMGHDDMGRVRCNGVFSNSRNYCDIQAHRALKTWTSADLRLKQAFKSAKF